MAPQLRAQDPAKKPDTVAAKVFRHTDVPGTHGVAVPAQPPRPIPKESILRVDTLRAATRRPDGICNYDQKAAKALTPTPGSGTRLLPIDVDPVACRIIVVTVDSAKFVEATKQAKRDTLAKPAVIYSYSGGRSTTDSVRVLQRPFVAPTPKRAKPPAPGAVMKVPPPVKLDTNTVTIYRHGLHGAPPQWPTLADTAEIQRIALTYLQADSNYVRTVDRRPLLVRGDTAIASFWYGAEVSVVRLERRNGKWVPSYRGSGVK